MPLFGFRARVPLGSSALFMACTGPPGRTVHFWEYSASRGGCIRVGTSYLSAQDPSTGNFGWRTGFGAAITRVSHRAGPQNDADRAVSSVRGTVSGDRDAEYSGFCTVQAGVRWGGKGYLRLFMHGASIIMQDIKASYGRRSDRSYHAPKFAALFPRRARIRREEGAHTRAHSTEGI